MPTRQKHQAQAVEDDNIPSAGMAPEIMVVCPSCPNDALVQATVMAPYVPNFMWCQPGGHAIFVNVEDQMQEKETSAMTQASLDAPRDTRPAEGQSADDVASAARRSGKASAPSQGGTMAATPEMTLAIKLLKQFETGSAFERLETQIAVIEELETFIADDRSKITSAQTAMDGVKTSLMLAGVSGKNETERKASLEQACQDDGLYMRAVQEMDGSKRRIDTHEASASAARRRFTAIRLEIEARISSKQLMASVLGG